MVKLWKKAVSLTVVLGVLFSMSMVSFASDRGSSPSVGSSASVGSSSSAASSDTVFGVSSDTKGVGIYDLDSGIYFGGKVPAAYSKIDTQAGLKQILGNLYKEGTELKLIGPMDVTSETLPVTIEFNIEGISKNDTVYVLHWTEDEKGNGFWEVIVPRAVGDNYVSAYFTELSPVAFVKAVNTKDGGPAKTSDGSTKSPKTGMF
jgi:hypothetical protein